MISVIIPSKNRQSYLLDLLSDLHQQELPVDEIIVVDQSDQPYEGLSEIIHIKDIGNIGPCRARNLALEHCRGDIILFLDDDVRVEPDYVQTICNPILAGESLVVVAAICDKDGVYPNKISPLWKKGYKNWLLALTANPDFPGRCSTLSFATGCAAIHRSVYEKIGGFDEFFDPEGAGEDREYGLRIFHAGYAILYEGHTYIKHLGAPSGGRRGTPSGFRYQNILEANSVYIIAKYFGWEVFNEYCESWLNSILRKGIKINPRWWGRSINWWLEARNYVRDIRKIKLDRGW